MPKVLYFHNGIVPQDEAIDRAARYEALGVVCFRNAEKIEAGTITEKAEYVAGDVPPDYAMYPRADDHLQARLDVLNGHVAPKGERKTITPAPSGVVNTVAAPELPEMPAAGINVGNGTENIGTPAIPSLQTKG